MTDKDSLPDGDSGEEWVGPREAKTDLWITVQELCGSTLDRGGTLDWGGTLDHGDNLDHGGNLDCSVERLSPQCELASSACQLGSSPGTNHIRKQQLSGVAPDDQEVSTAACFFVEPPTPCVQYDDVSYLTICVQVCPPPPPLLLSWNRSRTDLVAATL